VSDAQLNEPLQDPLALQGALEGVFAHSQSEILGTLYYLLGNWDDARDCLQETFLKCWRARHEASTVRNLKAWVFRIAINTGRDARSTTWKRHRTSIEQSEIVYDMHPSPEAVVLGTERMQRLQQAISQLRAEDREVFLLRQNGSFTYDEIADLLKMPSGTVKTRMRLALTELRKVFIE
jgi:RNA polymerase sigma factor (sigma-70 family)